MFRLNTALVAGSVLESIGAAAAHGAASHIVGHRGRQFSESKMSISVGDTIIFKNDDDVDHDVVVDRTSIHTGTMEPGEECAVSFDRTGLYRARCRLHPQMKLTILVK